MAKGERHENLWENPLMDRISKKKVTNEGEKAQGKTRGKGLHLGKKVKKREWKKKGVELCLGNHRSLTETSRGRMEKGGIIGKANGIGGGGLGKRKKEMNLQANTFKSETFLSKRNFYVYGGRREKRED